MQRKKGKKRRKDTLSGGRSPAPSAPNIGGSLAGTLGVQNPFRYRGYVYDQETGLYYLQTRYYDPELGRFISADDLSYLGAGGELLGYNLFAYCGNNPVSRSDPDGNDWKTAFFVGIAVAGAGLIIIVTLPFSGPMLAGMGAATATATATAAAANAAVKAGLTVASVSIIQAATTSPNQTGTSTYDDKEKNERIEYEYYGNGNGNVHYEIGKAKTKIWKIENGKETFFELPKKLAKTVASNPKMQRAISKGIRAVKTLGETQ